jgi:hypothetical protein
MTEAEWLTCADPRPMLESLRGRASDRKLRLFGAACCRRIWHLLEDERCREGVVAAERFADKLVWDHHRTEARNRAREVSPPGSFSAAGKAVAAVCAALDGQAYFAALSGSRETAATRLHAGGVAQEKKAQAELLRDILGYPFSSVTIEPAWLAWGNGAVRAFAQAVYDERTFEQAPILADALEDAGCANAGLLDHLRGPGPHTRGCWVIDALTGKR